MFAKKFATILPAAMRASAQHARNPLMAAACSVRGFSSVELVDRAGLKLAKSLEKEIKYENENYTVVDDVENFIKESGFTFSEADDSPQMTLKKTFGKYNITIQFEAR